MLRTKATAAPKRKHVKRKEERGEQNESGASMLSLVQGTALAALSCLRNAIWGIASKAETCHRRLVSCTGRWRVGYRGRRTGHSLPWPCRFVDLRYNYFKPQVRLGHPFCFSI